LEARGGDGAADLRRSPGGRVVSAKPYQLGEAFAVVFPSAETVILRSLVVSTERKQAGRLVRSLAALYQRVWVVPQVCLKIRWILNN
jgi:hypothetical protein